MFFELVATKITFTIKCTGGSTTMVPLFATSPLAKGENEMLRTNVKASEIAVLELFAWHWIFKHY